MTHYIIQVGNFFGSFFFICISFLLLRSFGHGLGNHNHKVFGVNFQSFFYPCNGFDIFQCIWSDTEWIALKHLTGGPFYHCSTISLTGRSIWQQSDSVLSSSLPQITSDAGNSRWARPEIFFLLPKKYISASPHSVFSPLSSRLLFLDCLTICCSECL